MLGCHGERKLALEGLFFLLSLLPLGKWAAHAHRSGAFTRRSLRVSSVSRGDSPEAGEGCGQPRAAPAASARPTAPARSGSRWGSPGIRHRPGHGAGEAPQSAHTEGPGEAW